MASDDLGAPPVERRQLGVGLGLVADIGAVVAEQPPPAFRHGILGGLQSVELVLDTLVDGAVEVPALIAERACQVRLDLLEPLCHERSEQRVLALEVRVDRADRVPGSLRHVRDGGTPKALLGKDVACGFEEAGSGQGLALVPAESPRPRGRKGSLSTSAWHARIVAVIWSSAAQLSVPIAGSSRPA